MAKTKELKFSVGREERSLILIANFIDGFTSDFVFHLHESFREALYIKLTPKNIFGKTENIYTQGRNFSFKSGDVIYDSKKAYLEKWGEALKYIKYFVQIVSARDASISINETFENVLSPIELKLTNIDSSTSSITRESLIINKYKYDSGLVKFKLYKPNDDKSNVIQINEYECTQEYFITFLQNGILRTLNKEVINILQRA